MESSAYYTSTILDKSYPVAAARINTFPAGVTEFKIGDTWAQAVIVAISFYTGFPGCPARYTITARETAGHVSSWTANAG